MILRVYKDEGLNATWHLQIWQTNGYQCIRGIKLITCESSGTEQKREETLSSSIYILNIKPGRWIERFLFVLMFLKYSILKIKEVVFFLDVRELQLPNWLVALPLWSILTVLLTQLKMLLTHVSGKIPFYYWEL